MKKNCYYNRNDLIHLWLNYLSIICLLIVSSCSSEITDNNPSSSLKSDFTVEKARYLWEDENKGLQFLSLDTARTKSVSINDFEPQWDKALLLNPKEGITNVEIPLVTKTHNIAVIEQYFAGILKTKKELSMTSSLVISENKIKGYVRKFIITKIWLDKAIEDGKSVNDFNVNSLTFIYSSNGQYVTSYETREGKIRQLQVYVTKAKNKKKDFYKVKIGSEELVFLFYNVESHPTTKSSTGGCVICGTSYMNYVCPACGKVGFEGSISGYPYSEPFEYRNFFVNLINCIRESTGEVISQVGICDYGYCSQTIWADAVTEILKPHAMYEFTIDALYTNSRNYEWWTLDASSSYTLFFSAGYMIAYGSANVFYTDYGKINLYVFRDNEKFKKNLYGKYFELDTCEQLYKPEEIRSYKCYKCGGCLNHSDHSEDIYCASRCDGYHDDRQILKLKGDKTIVDALTEVVRRFSGQILSNIIGDLDCQMIDNDMFYGKIEARLNGASIYDLLYEDGGRFAFHLNQDISVGGQHAKNIMSHELFHLYLYNYTKGMGSPGELGNMNPDLLSILNRHGGNIGDAHHEYMRTHGDEVDAFYRKAFPGQEHEFYEYGKYSGTYNYDFKLLKEVVGDIKEARRINRYIKRIKRR